jgi:uncharacterized protein YozE (UPF0346 family)
MNLKELRDNGIVINKNAYPKRTPNIAIVGDYYVERTINDIMLEFTTVWEEYMRFGVEKKDDK